MGSEVFLYAYGLVCLSMLVFNIVYSLHLRSSDRRLRRQVRGIAARAEIQMDRIRQGLPVEVRHRSYMARRLSRAAGLLAFDHYLDELDSNDPVFQEYLHQMRPVLLRLAIVYQKREDTQAAYFCHFLARHNFQRHMQMDQIQQIVATYMGKKSIYCRVNALKALCALGRPETVVAALLDLDGRPGAQLHEKIITETLLTFTGEPDALIRLLWERFDRFSSQIQRAVLDYIRFQSGSHCQAMFALLQDAGRGKELRLAAIRYLGKYPYPPARQALVAFVEDPDPLQWEYAAISATSLAQYQGDDVVEALRRAIHSGNWYVRSNAAASLEAHGVSYEDVLDVVAGEDRYAKEMLAYRLESRRLAEENEEALAKT